MLDLRSSLAQVSWGQIDKLPTRMEASPFFRRGRDGGTSRQFFSFLSSGPWNVKAMAAKFCGGSNYMPVSSEPSFRASALPRRLAGLAGLAGSLLFFAGDMLFYGYSGPGADFSGEMLATVRQASTERLLFGGGLVGPLAACLCIAGLWHVYRNVRPQAVWAGWVMLFGFAALMVVGSAGHTLWTAKGLAIMDCYGEGAPCSDLLAATKSYWTIPYNLSPVPGYLGAVILAVLVLWGKTWYPRWTVLANPTVLILILPLAAKLPARFGSVVVGGAINLSIAIFFLVSLLTTWTQGGSAEETQMPQAL